jgi:hypothetical protein
MRGKWVQVWGIERGSTETNLLFAFPDNQWTPAQDAWVREELKQNGTTGVEIKRVEFPE